MITTRFAPSPTGPLHLGHAYSALFAHDMAKADNGTFHLRIEDIDQTRSRETWETQIYEDLRWLGVAWAEPVMRQSDRMAAYQAALDTLWHEGLLYVCRCNRRDILAAADAPQEGGEPATGPDGVIYPGTCRHKQYSKGAGALRLDMTKALNRLSGPLTFVEKDTRQIVTDHQLLDGIGDVVLARKDMGTSYHLSVVIDDAAQGISCVTRGSDLFEATPIHVLLQRLLGFETPQYHHHRLVRDEAGKRLAKRDDARALATLRDDGHTPADIRQMIGLP